MNDFQKQIDILSAETLVLQTLLIRILAKAERFGGDIRGIIESALDETEEQLTNATLGFGANSSPFHLAEAVKISLQFRAAILGQERPAKPVDRGG